MGVVRPRVLFFILFSVTPFPGPPPVRIVRHRNFGYLFEMVSAEDIVVDTTHDASALSDDDK
jgi:hypothetical protein